LRILAPAREGFDVVLSVTDVSDPEAADGALDEEELFFACHALRMGLTWFRSCTPPDVDSDRLATISAILP